jgi:uncharacterized protein (TIGR02646 family)
MRFIEKTSSPASLEAWKTRRNNANQSLNYRELSGVPQLDLKTQLIDEQKHICCYCQQVITKDNSTIEHFLPQSKFKLHEVDYLNLHLVCNHSRGLRGDKKYCDVKKENELIVNTILHPDCEEFFKYSANGEILPNNPNYHNFNNFIKNMSSLSIRDQALVQLIRALNLNAEEIVNRRLKILKDLLKIIDREFDSIQKIDNYFNREKLKVKSSRFPSLVKYYLTLKRHKLN